MLAPTYEEIKMSEVALLAPTYEEIKVSEVALLAPTYEEIKMSEVALLAPTYEEIKMSEVALLAPTYEYGYVGFVVLFFHSGSIITRGWVGWKGKVGSEQYVSCMFHVCFGFLDYFFVFSCQNCVIF